ncbi:hypothetical protein Vafri_19869 [Volvox africanus]|uniref:Protein kinase domain-containing protein n=1 Tax=Volvox africanus TaxID=51714 RepID=A0A8J4FDB7_9CHLO|nr:hypothetical protein Vafri_19869 [Volvox africanus]
MAHSQAHRRTIRNWEIQEVVGSGSFAIVWRARHVTSGALAAVKEILSDRLNKKLHESLESEIAVLQRLKHANIVGLLDLHKEPGKIFLVLEYCAGGDLAQHLRQRGPVSEASCRYLLRQLAEGLKVLRQHNVIHRDLKPQNLLLSDTGPSPTLKIADFGFARSLQPAGLAETLCGSPLYMAPEVLQLHRYDAKADLWSVGTILFELLTGKPPFNGVNHLQLIQNIERGDAVLPEHVARSLSPGCRQLLHQLLRRNPVERISFDELFVHPFLLGEAASAAAGSALPAGVSQSSSGAPHSQQQPPGPQHQRRHAPTSHGAVRIVQPTRTANPIHPALAVPSPTGSQQLQLPQRQQDGISAKGAAGAAAVAGAVAATVQSSLAAQTPSVLPPALAPEFGAAATLGPSIGGGGGRNPGIAAINVRELTRSPSPRIIAAAAAVESAFQGDAAVVPAASTTSANLSDAVAEAVPGSSGSGSGARPHRGPAAPLSLDRVPSGLVATPSASSTSLGDSLDSDYVVVASPSTASRPGPMPMSPRTQHPAMTCVSGRSSAQSSRNGSGGGVGSQPTSRAGPAQVLQAPSAPSGPEAAIAIPPGPCGRGQPVLNNAPTAAAATPRAPGPALVAAAAAAAAAPPVAWQQLLPPIAAATLPPSHHSNLHNPTPLAAAIAAAGAPSSSPAIPTNPAANAAAAAATTVTIRVPPPGCSDGSAGDPQLLPRLVGLLLDDAGRRCSALLDQEAEARQLGAARSAAVAAAEHIGSFVAGGGVGPGGGDIGDGETQLAEEAASAVGTYLVACRLLLAALSSNTAASQPPLGGSQEGGRTEKYATGSGAPTRSPSGKGLRADAEAEAEAEAERSPAVALAALAASVPTGANAVMPPSVPVAEDMTDGSGDGRVEAQEQRTDEVTSAVTSPSSSSGPSLAVLSALAVHARSLLAALDEHLHGTVAKLLLSGSEGSELPQPSRPPPQTHEARGASPDTAAIRASPGPVVPCGMDTLLATAIHHSRAAAGEELLGNAAGAADQYGRAADVLLFLLSAPQHSHPSHSPKGTGGGQEALLEAVRPPLPPHERQRITKYYAAVRLRQSAVLAALGPTAAATLPPSLQLPAGPQSLPRPELPAPYAPGRPLPSHPLLHPGPNLHVRHPSAGGGHGSAVEGVTTAAAPVTIPAESGSYGYVRQPRVYGAVVF